METNENLFDTAVRVKELKAGDTVLQFFELKAKEVRRTRSGQDYLDLMVGDASGAIAGKMWADAIRKWGTDFEPGDIVKIEGRVEAYRDKNQIVVEKIRKSHISEVPDSSSVIRCSPLDPEKVLTELIQIAVTLKPPQLSDLVAEVLTENREALMTCPAARMIHHAYRGGLVEHMLTVTRKVEAILALESKINRSLALAGAMLHDIGKIRELNAAGKNRTAEGRLLGHVVLGTDMIRSAAARKGIQDEPWLCELEHILLSHHGEPEFGAAVRPLTREAILVHFIDNLDSKLKIIDEALESADSEGFSAYNKWLAGKAYSGSDPVEQEDRYD
ncbi:MAG: HD domain-containing protein [Thermodesulfobacteriota bacterium]